METIPGVSVGDTHITAEVRPDGTAPIDACLVVKGVFGRVWSSGWTGDRWLGVGWGLARGG